MSIPEINAVGPGLSHAIHHALLKSVNSADERCINAPEEPDYVASLVLEFTPDLYNLLKIFFPHNKINVCVDFLPPETNRTHGVSR